MGAYWRSNLFVKASHEVGAHSRRPIRRGGGRELIERSWYSNYDLITYSLGVETIILEINLIPPIEHDRCEIRNIMRF